MKKLKLQVETLNVESFPMKAQGEIRGTVHALSNAYSDCWPDACWDTVNSACLTYGTACAPGCSGTTCDDTSCNCDSYTCPGGGGDCDKPSMWYNDCAI
jgi:hypothetical protein